MPQLIIDDAAKQLVLNKLPGQPIFGGPDGGLLAPGVIDPIEDGPEDRWQPNDIRAQGLVLAVEACREIKFQAARFNEPGQRRRTVKSLTVPVCALMDVVGRLLTEFNKPEWQATRKAWPRSDRENYGNVSRTFRKKRFKGPVRQVRNTLAAHVTPDALQGSTKLSPDDLLLALGDSLILLILTINHPGAFTWIRSLGVTPDGGHRVVETMYTYPICVRWLTDMDGYVKDISVSIAADPVKDLQNQVVEAVVLYNDLIRQAGSAMKSISLTPTEELRVAESRQAPPSESGVS